MLVRVVDTFRIAEKNSKPLNRTSLTQIDPVTKLFVQVHTRKAISNLLSD